MYTDARKLQLIEAVLKTENEEILQTLETVVANANTKGQQTEGKFSTALGLLTNEEAEAMKHTIEEAFEKINPDNWK